MEDDINREEKLKVETWDDTLKGTSAKAEPQENVKPEGIPTETKEKIENEPVQEIKVVEDETKQEKDKDKTEVKEEREMTAPLGVPSSTELKGKEGKMGKEGSFAPIVIIMLASLAIAGLWNSIPIIKNSIHSILDPSAGALLNWEITYGMLILVFILTAVMTLTQKYATDQETLREMKKEQKELSAEMKKYREHPEKVMALQKKQFEFMPKMFKLSMRPMMYTGIPIILFFRWFMDYFNHPDFIAFRFFGFFTWFWFYLVSSIVFSSVLRKVLKVV